MDKRVVITGVGLVTPLGIGVDDTWSALCAGKSGISRITRFDTEDFQTKIAHEHPGQYVGDDVGLFQQTEQGAQPDDDKAKQDKLGHIRVDGSKKDLHVRDCAVIV